MSSSKKIVMCGCAEYGVDMIDYLFSNDIQISNFVSLTPVQGEKYNVSGYRSFEDVSKKYNVPIYYPKSYSLKTVTDLDFFKKNKFDLLILGGWQRLIPDDILKTLNVGGLGLHGSSEFLPKGRGRSPVNWSLIEGKNQFILHLFLLSPGIDDGNIIDYKIFDINNWDTCKTLYYKISISSKTLLKEYIPKLLSNNFSSSPQKGEPSFYPKRTPSDGQIDWSKSLIEIYNFIRALTKPYPGAFSYLNGNSIYIWKAQPFDTKIQYLDKEIGQVVEKFSSNDILIKTKTGILLVTEYDGEVSQNDIFENKF